MQNRYVNRYVVQNRYVPRKYFGQPSSFENMANFAMSYFISEISIRKLQLFKGLRADPCIRENRVSPILLSFINRRDDNYKAIESDKTNTKHHWGKDIKINV